MEWCVVHINLFSLYCMVYEILFQLLLLLRCLLYVANNNFLFIIHTKILYER